MFSPENGFEIQTVLLHENVAGGKWYRVTDPDKVGLRVELCNTKPTYIFTIAKRIEKKEVFQVTPQQSDYVAVWDDPNAVLDSHNGWQSKMKVKTNLVKKLIPKPLKNLLLQTLNLLKPKEDPFDQPYYHQLSKADLLSGRIRDA